MSKSNPRPSPKTLAALGDRIERCELCPRLRSHCKTIAESKRRAYESETYWGRPVRGFGDPRARVWVLGLAPAAHGANRTGRIFTGDQSGLWLYRALHKAGFANQPISTQREDGLVLKDVFVSCAARCAPPQNKLTSEELKACRPYLKAERELLSELQVVIALGSVAWQAALQILHETRAPKFGHGAIHQTKALSRSRGLPILLIGSYHPSQQNTFTKRLTEPMFDSIFERTKRDLR